MKKFTIIVTILVSIAVLFTFAHAETSSKVLLIPREGNSIDLELMLTKEVGVMISMLEKAGFEVEVATVSGVPLVASNVTLKPDLKLADVKVADYVGIIMPCMAVGLFPGPPLAPEAVEIVKQAVTENKPVAAAVGSAYILAEAGILKGKRYAFYLDPLSDRFGPNKDPRFFGAIYSGRNVVQDGNIITSGVCPLIGKRRNEPDETANLTQALIAELTKRKNP